MLWLTFTPITTPSAHHYGVSVNDIGWLAEIFPLLYVLLAVPAASLLDRWFRPTLAVGALLTAVGGRAATGRMTLRLGARRPGADRGRAAADPERGHRAGERVPERRTHGRSGSRSARPGSSWECCCRWRWARRSVATHLHTLLVIDGVFGVVATIAMLVAFAFSPAMHVSGDVTGMFGLGTVWREPRDPPPGDGLVHRLRVLRRADDLAADTAQASRDLGLDGRLDARRRRSSPA